MFNFEKTKNMKLFTKKTKINFGNIMKGLVLSAVFLSTSDVFAQPGAALNFTGGVSPSSRVNLGTAITSSISNLNKFSVEAWVRPTSLSGLGCVIGNYGTGGSSMQFLIRRDNSNYNFFIGDGVNFQSVLSASPATLNVWQHVAGIWNGTVASIYINGVFSASASITYTSMGVTSNPIWIGANTINENFAGDIDEVRIWNRALCPAEFQNNYLAELPLAKLGLLAYYRFNQGIAGGSNGGVNTLTDSGPSSVTGTLASFALTGATANWITPGGVTSGSLVPDYFGGSVTVNSGSINPGSTFTMNPSGGTNYTYSAPGTATVSPSILSNYTVYSYVGNCLHKAVSTVSVNANSLHFDPADDYVNAGTALNASLSTSNKITVEAWARPSSFSPALGCIVGNYNTTSGNNMQFLIRRSSTNWQFFVGNSANGGYTSVASLVTPTINVWQHVAGVWNGTVMSIYVNGVFSNSVSCTYSAMGVQSNQVWLGANSASGTENYHGFIDEVRIWNRALCQGEIQNNMNGELSLPQNGLLSYYKLNNGISGGTNTLVTTAADSGPVNATGTLTNMSLTGISSNWMAPGGIPFGVNAPLFTIPSFSVAGTTNICLGNSTTLTASGASTYTWSTGANTASISASPTVTTVYNVVGTSSNACQATVFSTVNVNPLPVISVNSGSICSGNSFTITPGGAATYTIQGGNAVVSPTANATYTVMGTSSLGCVSASAAVSSVTVVVCTGVAENVGVLNGTNLYPNPNKGVFTIELPIAANVSVINVIGKEILNKNIEAGKNTINLTDFSTGVYFVKVKSGESQVIYKVIAE